MSKYENCLTCDASEVTLEELLKSLFVKDSFGNIGIELKLNLCDENNTSAVSCDLANQSLAELLKQALIVDECGKCSLKVFVDVSSLNIYV